MAAQDHTEPEAEGDLPASLGDVLAEVIALPEHERRAAIDAACARMPADAERLRARFDALAALGLLDESEQDRPAAPDRLGEFELVRRLGGGGMGVVYLARQTELGREVALKVIRPELALFENADDRFRREAEAAARLDHPGIVPVYTFGRTGGVLYLAMQRVDGCSLAAVLARLRGRDVRSLAGGDLLTALRDELGAVDPDAADRLCAGSWQAACARTALQVADALAHAHARGVVHRDVKPSNVMVGRDGRLQLVDFGLAAAAGQSRLTRTGVQLGTVGYSAPEQMTGGTVDERADVFALGVVLYELLALQAPFEGRSSEDTLRRLLTRDPAEPSRQGARVSPDLWAIVATALDKAPARRYPNATALADDLRAFLEHRPVSARRMTPGRRLVRWARREPVRATLAALLAVAVLSILVSLPVLAAGRAQIAAEALQADLAAGHLALVRGQHDDARAAFERALARSPRCREAEAGLEVLGETPASVPTGERATPAEPAEPAELYAAALRLRFLGGHFDRAWARAAWPLLTEAVLSARDPSLSHYELLAQAAGNLGELEAARPVARAMVRRWPKSSVAHYWAGYALLEVDRPAAIACLRQAAVLEPDVVRAPALADLGAALHEEGDVEGALDALGRSIAIDPKVARTWLDFGIARLSHGETGPAVAALEVATTLEPSLPGAHYNLGVALAAAGEPGRAVVAYRRTLELAPDYWLALHNLGILQADGGEPEAAVATLTRLTALRPEWAEGFRTLGWACAQAGDGGGACGAYQRVVALAPDDALAHDYLCQLLEQQGDQAALSTERERWRQRQER